MNQITEELKNEDDQIRVSNLSDYKIQLECWVPILLSHNDSLRVIGRIKLKTRYSIDKDERRHHFELPIYNIIYPKDRFLQIISQNWKIKKKFISLQMDHSLYKIGDYQVKGKINGLIFDDPSWARNFLLETILNETRDN